MALATKDHIGSWLTLATTIPSSDDERNALEEVLCEAAASETRHAVLMIFRDIEQSRDLARLVNSLCEHPSWTCASSHDIDPLLSGEHRNSICLRWKMPDGSDSHALGFGPFGFLPATRRAPYPTLTLPVCTAGNFRDPKLPMTERHLCDMRNDVFEPENNYRNVGGLTSELRNQIVEPHNDRAAKARVTLALPDNVFHLIGEVSDAP